MSGQADQAPTMQDLAGLFLGEPDTGPADEEREEDDDAPESTDNADVDDESPDDADDDAEDDDGDEDAEKPEGQKSDRTYEVTVKGEDGADQKVKVTEAEMIAGYQRHADYTRKAMELGNRERQAAQVFTQNVEQARSYYVQQAEIAQQLVNQLVGVYSPDQMQQLAQSDPATWAREKQRMEHVQNVMQRLGTSVQEQQQRSQQEHEQMFLQAQRHAEDELRREGVTPDESKRVFESMQKNFGMDVARLNQIQDANVFRIMRAAANYEALKNKKPTNQVKPKESPKTRIPQARQSVPSSEKSKSLDRKFSSGRATKRDLASFIMQNQ